MTGDCSHHHENFWKIMVSLKILRSQKSGNIMQSGKGDWKGCTTAEHGSPFSKIVLIISLTSIP